ncbi:hypothetical protein DMB42_28690 [Nonomuraea sp. WAC 01424]|uniref:hypothetical protein n=1 Tax=Nonomuraea sp. WAC 01424 TaxID=2203200 RepID=UPI000F775BCD|nr:hypothetical protein [Nonomuraea sp. WAC 01424]RSN04784.1 hypothetical protein DMB42_28690 [Nonomuraea sp. WAC 01424]
MSNRSARALSRALIATAVAAATVLTPALTGTGSARAAADPTCGNWVPSLVFRGLSARACIWGTGAPWKQAQTEVFNGTGFAVEVERLTALIESLPADARCVNISLQNGQTAFCGTRSVPDNNPFQFDRVLGSVQVTDLARREQFSFESPFVG